MLVTEDFDIHNTTQIVTTHKIAVLLLNFRGKVADNKKHDISPNKSPTKYRKSIRNQNFVNRIEIEDLKNANPREVEKLYEK